MSYQEGNISTLNYAYVTTLEKGVNEAISLVTEALKQEGFGILTVIDVKETLKKKLDVDYTPYVILGACNPQLAYRALTEEADIGLLLPCNVIVRQIEDGTLVAAVDPIKMLGVVENPNLIPIAEEAREKLRRVIRSL